MLRAVKTGVGDSAVTPKSLGTPRDDTLAVVGLLPPCMRMLFLDDDAADVPEGFDPGGVDGLPGAVPSGGEDRAGLAVERLETGIGYISVAAPLVEHRTASGGRRPGAPRSIQ